MTVTLPVFHSIGGLCSAWLAMMSAHTSLQKAGYCHHQRSVLIGLRCVLYTSLQPDVHKDFSHVPLFTEWLTVPKLFGPLQPLTGQYTPCWVSHLTKNCLGKASKVGSYRQLFTGLDFTASYLDSSLQMKVWPAETHQLLSVDPVLYGFEFKEKATYNKGLSAHEGHKQIQRACVVPTEWSRSWLGEGGWTTSLSISVCLALQCPD